MKPEPNTSTARPTQASKTSGKQVIYWCFFLIFLVSLLLAWLVSGTFLWGSGVSFVVMMLTADTNEQNRRHQKQKESERFQREHEQQTQIVCPHCHSRGHVTTRKVKMKKGISGAKATAAVLTGGLTILGTGLSRKEQLTEATCSNCGSTWHF